MNYNDNTQLKNVTELRKLLEKSLDAINDAYDTGDCSKLDSIFDDFSLTITFKEESFDISLGSMDAYSAFCNFLTKATDYIE